jgi:hypothetical protein
MLDYNKRIDGKVLLQQTFIKPNGYISTLERFTKASELRDIFMVMVHQILLLEKNDQKIV